MSATQWIRIIFIHVLTLRHSRAAEGDGLSLDAVKKLCSVAVRAKTTAKDIVAQLQSREGAITQLLSLQAKLQLGQCAGNGQLVEALSVLSTFVQTKIERTAEKTAALAKLGAAAAAHQAYVAGNVDDTLKVFNAAKDSGSNKHCLTRDNSGNVLANLNNAQAGCGADLTTEGGSRTVTQPYNHAEDTDVGTANRQPNSGAADCLITKQSTGYLNGQAPSANSITWAAGMLSVSSSGPAINTVTKVGTRGDNQKLPLLTAAAAAYKAYHEEATALQTQPREGNYETWKDDNDLNNAIKMFLLAQTRKGADTDVSSQIKPEKQRLFGDDQTGIKSKVWDKLNSFPALAEVNNKVLTKKISDLSGLDDIEKAAMYCVLQQTKASTQSEINCPKHDQSTTAEALCNAIGDNNNTGCSNTPGCHFVSSNAEGKKCTVNPATTKAAKEAEKPAGTDSKNESKCADKKTEGDCKDGCKWEGTECKDSSILASKQIALTVVSAAFAALLF